MGLQEPARGWHANIFPRLFRLGVPTEERASVNEPVILGSEDGSYFFMKGNLNSLGA